MLVKGSNFRYRLFAAWLALLLIAFPCRSGVPYAVRYTVCAYCPCSLCTGRHSALGSAANGKPPVAGQTIAGPRRFPLGTRLQIEGLGERILTDRPARKYDDRFEIFFRTHAEAKRFGKQTLIVTIK